MPRLNHAEEDEEARKPIVQSLDDGGSVVTMPAGTVVPDDIDDNLVDRRRQSGRAGEQRGRQRGHHGNVPAVERIRQLNGALFAERQKGRATAAELERTRGELATTAGNAAMLDQAAFENWGAGAEGRLGKAQADYKKAREDGDTDLEAAASADIAVASVDVANFKRQKVAREGAAAARKANPVPPVEKKAPTVTRATQRFLDANPGIQDKEVWDAAVKLHDAAIMSEGLVADTPEYFHYIATGLNNDFPDHDEFVDHPDLPIEEDEDDGGGRRDTRNGRAAMRQDDDEPPARQVRRPTGAPVNRRTVGAISTTNGRVRINMTPEMNEAAKIAGVTVAQYAASLLKPDVARRVAEARRKG